LKVLIIGAGAIGSLVGGELAQPSEWNHDTSIAWHLRDVPDHAGVQRLVRDLNHVYRDVPALWRHDATPDGFAWLEGGDSSANVFAFARFGDAEHPPVVCVANLSPVPREGYRVGLPRGGRWLEVLNTDAHEYAGSGMGNDGAVDAEAHPFHGQEQSTVLTLPPLAVLWLTPERG